MRRPKSDQFYRLRFWQQVDKSGDCWLWTRSRNSDGYGVAHCRIGGEVPTRSAHRIHLEAVTACSRPTTTYAPDWHPTRTAADSRTRCVRWRPRTRTTPTFRSNGDERD